MATKTFEELRKLAIQIRDEKANKQNTALRIGNFLLSSLDKMESMDIADIAEAVLQAETAADEAKRQADIVAQSGDIVEEAIKQGAAAEAAAAAANAAADKATNEGLFKTQQDLSEEEQGQVKRNLGIEDLMASLEAQTIEGFSETVNATTSTKSVDNIIPPFIDFAIVDLGSTDGRELPTTPSMSVVLAKVTDDGRVKMQGYLKTSHEEYNIQVVSGSAEKYALNVNIITDIETTYKVFQIRYLSSFDGGKFKGSYGQLSQLQAAYPTAKDGSYAFVGNPRHLYEWATNAWTDRGEFTTSVDQAIDPQSERAIANKAVSAKLTELEDNGYNITSIFNLPYQKHTTIWIGENGALKPASSTSGVLLYKVNPKEKLYLSLSPITGNTVDTYYHYAFYNELYVDTSTFMAEYSYPRVYGKPFSGTVEVPESAKLIGISIFTEEENNISKESSVYDETILIQENLSKKLDKEIQLYTETLLPTPSPSFSGGYNTFELPLDGINVIKLKKIEINNGNATLTFLTSNDVVVDTFTYLQGNTINNTVFDKPAGADKLRFRVQYSDSNGKQVVFYKLEESEILNSEEVIKNAITKQNASSLDNIRVYNHKLTDIIDYVRTQSVDKFIYSFDVAEISALYINWDGLYENSLLQFRNESDEIVQEITSDSFVGYYSISEEIKTVSIKTYYLSKIGFTYKATYTDSTQTSEISKILSFNKNVTYTETLKNYSESLITGMYTDFSSKTPGTKVNGMSADIGGTFSVSGEGINSLEVTEEGYAHTEQNFYMGYDFNQPITSISAKIKGNRVVLIIADVEKDKALMCHFQLGYSSDNGYSGTLETRNDELGVAVYKGFKTLYTNKSFRIDNADDVIEWDCVIDGEILYVLLNNEVVEVKENRNEVGYRFADILNKPNRAIWQDGKLVEVTAGVGFNNKFAMRSVYRIKKLLGM